MEYVSDCAQDTDVSLKPEKETYNWDSGTAVGRFAASLMDTVKEETEPKVPEETNEWLKSESEWWLVYIKRVNGP